MKVFLGFVIMISFTVIANLLMKIGADAPIAGRFFSIVHWKTIAGLASFGMAGLVYALLLKWLPLNVAQAFASAQFIAVILASTFILSESITPLRWAGIALIASGILVVGMTVKDFSHS